MIDFTVLTVRQQHTDSFRSRHVAEHFLSVFCATSVTPGVVLLATCRSQTAIHALLTSTHVFSGVVQLKPPNKDARRDVCTCLPAPHAYLSNINTTHQILAGIVQSKVADSGLQVQSKHPLNYVSLATQTEGYLATDLRDLVSRAVHQATIRAAKTHLPVRTAPYKLLVIFDLIDS